MNTLEQVGFKSKNIFKTNDEIRIGCSDKDRFKNYTMHFNDLFKAHA